LPGRLEFERAIRRSSLPPPSRHLALTIATWADIETGVIPERFQPSMRTLLESTGMSKGSMLSHLKRLETEGWITVDRPDAHTARTEHVRNAYELAIPPAVQEELGQELTQPRSGADPAQEGARAGADLAQGQELTQAGSGADPEQGQELTPRVPSPSSPISPTVAEVETGPRTLRVAEARTRSDRASKKNDKAPGQRPLLLPVHGTQPARPVLPDHRRLADEMTEHYGRHVSVRHAAAVALAVLDGRPAPRDPNAYVMAAVRRDPDRHRPTSLPPTFAERRAAGEV